MTTEIMDLAVMPVMDINLAIERRSQIVKFVKAIMVENTDFGIIPGTDKPTLYKPGAEKLATFFGLTKRFGIIERVEDWMGKDHNSEPFFYYLYRCALWRGDLLIAEADGSCSSFEAKYRWRKAERVCPNCGQAAIIKGKSEYGGGWLCYGKKGGCGAKFKTGDQVIENQEVGRISNPDVADQVNTIQKMAQKRALVAAVLLAVNASEFFTQDIEDYIDAEFIPKDIHGSQVEEIKANDKHESSPVTTKTNGNGKAYKFPSTAAEKFYKVVQQSTGDYYKNPYHLLEIIGGWFNFASDDLWNERLSAAVDHARQTRESVQEPVVESQA